MNIIDMYMYVYQLHDCYHYDHCYDSELFVQGIICLSCSGSTHKHDITNQYQLSVNQQNIVNYSMGDFGTPGGSRLTQVNCIV